MIRMGLSNELDGCSSDMAYIDIKIYNFFNLTEIWIQGLIRTKFDTICFNATTIVFV